MNFKHWLINEELNQPLDSMLTTTFYKYVKETQKNYKKIKELWI
jgi:hypothetical protein